LPSADAETTEESEAAQIDEARQSLLEAVTAELGDAVVGHHLLPGRDVWVRVDSGAWSDTADYLRNRQRFRFFDYLSAVDWSPSPYGRSLDAAVDLAVGGGSEGADEDGFGGGDGPMERAAGGDTRFQAIARVYNLATGIGLHVKADIRDDLTIGTWIGTYPGAAWHEREAHEMFGISFVGNPDMRNLYLPTGFEGHPLRKDYPLMSRLVKPWPGIVDVEPMPDPSGPDQVPSSTELADTANPEAGQ
jgi:NADH-quinone oxidoreductase subunit C